MYQIDSFSGLIRVLIRIFILPTLGLSLYFPHPYLFEPLLGSLGSVGMRMLCVDLPIAAEVRIRPLLLRSDQPMALEGPFSSLPYRAPALDWSEYESRVVKDVPVGFRTCQHSFCSLSILSCRNHSFGLLSLFSFLATNLFGCLFRFRSLLPLKN